MRGGYIIVDLKGTALTSGTPATIEGVYDSVSAGYGKATLVTGMKVSTTSYDDMYIPFIKSGTSYVGTVTLSGATIGITVSNQSAVTVTVS